MTVQSPDYIDKLGQAVLPHHLRRLVDRMMSESALIAANNGQGTPIRASSMMRLLSERGPLGVVEISERLGLSHPLIIQFEKALVQLGLLRSKKNPKDQRNRLLILTKLGEAEAHKILETHARMSAVYDDLGREIGVDLYAAIIKANQALDNKNLVDRFNVATLNTEKHDV